MNKAEFFQKINEEAKKIMVSNAVGSSPEMENLEVLLDPGLQALAIVVFDLLIAKEEDNGEAQEAGD